MAHDTFYHFGKIAYAFYLVNPVVLIVMNGASDSLINVDPAVIIVFNAGICILSYQCAVICTLLFEMPYIKLYRIYTKARKEAKKKSNLKKKLNKPSVI